MIHPEHPLKKHAPAPENRLAAYAAGAVLLASLAALVYLRAEIAGILLGGLVSGALGAFFLRRYGIFGKLLCLAFFYPLFLVPRSVWRSVDQFENMKKGGTNHDQRDSGNLSQTHPEGAGKRT